MLAARADVITFSLPYYPVYHEIVALATNKQTLSQILNSGGVIAVETGSAADQWATKLLAAGDNFTKLGVDTYELALEAVGDGRAVGSLTDSSWLNPLLTANPAMAAEYKIVGLVGGFSTYGIGTRNGDVWLRSMLNHGLEDLMGTTQWQDLMTKWGIA
jgi:ABC-type amino acid transport substrate-binding protein